MRSGNGGEGGGRKGGKALGRARCCKRQGAHDDAFRELDLEGVVAGGSCVGERGFGGAPECCLVRAGARQHVLGRAGPPGLCCDAAKSNPRLVGSLPPSNSSAAAADTTAKAKDVRSRSFR